MISQPKIETRSEQPYAAIRVQVAMQDLGPVLIPQLHKEVRIWLNKQGMQPSGAPFIRYHVINMLGKLDVAIGWPVSSVLTGDGRIVADVIPAGRYAVLIYTGPFEGPALMQANAALIDWGAKEGLVWDAKTTPEGDAFGGRFEFYLTDPAEEPDSAKWQTEVAFRLAAKP